jgi:hypothetical protein
MRKKQHCKPWVPERDERSLGGEDTSTIAQDGTNWAIEKLASGLRANFTHTVETQIAGDLTELALEF